MTKERRDDPVLTPPAKPPLYAASLEHVFDAREFFPAPLSLEEALTKYVKATVRYSVTRSQWISHGLEAPGVPYVECEAHAQLMAGLCRSVGLPAQVVYLVNGKENRAYRYRGPGDSDLGKPMKSFQAGTPLEDDVDPEPYFPYHALVEAGPLDDLFDPTYGVASRPRFIEAVDPNSNPHRFLERDSPAMNSYAISAPANFQGDDREVLTTLSCEHREVPR